MFPDLKGNGLNHPFLFNWEHVVTTVQKDTRHGFDRELKVGDTWFYQEFYIVPETKNVHIYAMNINELKLAENSLRESEQRWATTLSSIGDAVIATDLDGVITFMNRIAEALTG